MSLLGTRSAERKRQHTFAPMTTLKTLNRSAACTVHLKLVHMYEIGNKGSCVINEDLEARIRCFVVS